MENILILLFILLANIVAVLLIYHSFDKNMEQTKKMLYTMISMGIMYILILIVYFFSSIGISKEAAQQSKNMITFTFVPVNAIILVPFILRSFYKRKNNDITTEQLNKRAMVMIVIAIILLISEFFYFRKIEKGIVDIANQSYNNQEETANNEITNNEIIYNETTNNATLDNEINNTQENNLIQNVSTTNSEE